ncbi:unnamed protein product [Diamesa serratosioi]
MMDLIVDLENTEERNGTFDLQLLHVKESLDDEEVRIKILEQKRLKIQQEIDVMEQEIKEEKKLYRRAIDGIIEERAKISLDYLNNFNEKIIFELSPISSSISLIASNKEAYENDLRQLEDPQHNDCNIDIEKIRYSLLENCIQSKEYYIDAIKSIKEHFKNKSEAEKEKPNEVIT